MYKLLLIWRYLLTRRIALLSIFGVMLGVAIMTIVNAVMLGFSREMENRIHGALSDVTISSRSSLRGFDDVDARMRDADKIAGDMIESMTPTVTTVGLLSYEYGGSEVITRQVQIVGIDAVTNEKVTAISQYLQHPENRKHLSFDLHEDGYDVQNPLFGADSPVRVRLADAGWKKRRADAEYERYRRQEEAQRRKEYEQSHKPDSSPESANVVADAEQEEEEEGDSPYDAALSLLPPAPNYDEAEDEATESSAPDAPIVDASLDQYNDFTRGPSVLRGNPFEEFARFRTEIDKATTQETGAIIGVGLVSGVRRRYKNPDTGQEEIRENLATIPGADVTLSFLAASTENALPSIVYDRFTIVDFYECHMAEYDDSFVFVPIDKLQYLRRMIASDGTKMATQILIKAKPGVKIEDLRDRLRDSEEFPENLFVVETWKDQQATTLAAVATELSLLNVVLFLSMGGAGFCILAIFYMIVVDKTRDVGILKSLGASGAGVMQIFLCYALVLGLIGAMLGMLVAFWFVAHIQEIADFLSRMMGREVFDPAVYMFTKVPAIIDPTTVFWIDVGAIAVAVVASVFPALRAARLRPVDALRV
ncbi:MAG: ABC transporter permease [Thermoguttaceae bacterium]|nr:ABC transporter permease [Thermoguttaceae bacterium]